MIKLLEELLGEAQAIPLEEVDNPDPQVADAEEVIGELSDNQKKLYTLKNRLIDEGKRLSMMQILHHNPEMNNRLFELVHKHALLHELFWSSIMYDLNAWTANLGVRRGWLIVNCPDSSNPQPPRGGWGKLSS